MTTETKAGKTEVKNKEQDDSLPVPPDGGWGWMVVLGSFIIHVIADGVYYSFGVFLVALLDHFEGAGRGELGWVGSIMIGTLLSVGPIASMLTNTFGCRIVTTMGSFLAFFGFIISMWAPNVYFLYFSLGILGGTGLGLVYLPAIVCISYYFEKRRAFATGIAVCGSGIGTFIFAPLSQILLDEYGWKGAILIEAGLLLNCIVAGLLFRPVEVKVRPKKKDSEQLLKSEENNGIPQIEIKSSVSAIKNDTGGGLTSSLHALPTSSQEAHANSRLHKSDLHLNVQESSSHHKSHHHHHAPKVVRKDAFYTGSLHHIPMFREHPDEYHKSMVSIHRDESVSDSKDEESKSSCTCLSEKNKAELKESMDLALFKDVLFELFAWSNFLTNFAFFVPYLFLPDKAQLLGISGKYASSLVSIIGITNTIGRLLFGFLADRKFVNRLMLYNTAVLLGGIVTIFSALANNYWLLASYASAYGLLIGVYVTLTPIIIVDLLGLEKLSNAFGLVMFFQGVATLLGPPIAGWFYDSTGSYAWPFVLFGTMLAISGVMLYPIPCIRRCLERRQGVQQHDVDYGKQVANSEYVAVTQRDGE